MTQDEAEFAMNIHLSTGDFFLSLPCEAKPHSYHREPMVAGSQHRTE